MEGLSTEASISARLVQIYLPESRITRLEEILSRHARKYWRETVPGGQEKYSCIVQQRYSQRLLDELESEFSAEETFVLTVQLLEAAYPPVFETPETAMPVGDDPPKPNRLERFFSRDRLSTDEILDDIDDRLRIGMSYLLTATLSAIIAGLGMRSGQTAVVIGAMIIAPLLSPTMGLALAATLGNRHLGLRAAATVLAGCFCAVAAGWLIGLILAIDPTIPELRNRTIVQPGDIALALACGAAGVLAFSRGASSALVGVMIAVALVPPLAASGMYFGAGLPSAGLNALFLFAVNLVCTNVAGIAMFLFQGLPPKSWRITGSILVVWSLILVLLALMATGRIVFGIGAESM